MTQFTNNTPVAISTAGTPVVTSTMLVSGANPFLFDLNLRTFITHTFNADLDITLTSPAGTVVTITSDNGGSNDNVFNGTIWDDDANPAGQVPYTTNYGVVTDHPFSNLVLAPSLTPEEALGAFIGENPNGLWTLTISDDQGGDGGSLNSWTLDLTALPTAPVTHSQTFTNNTPLAIPTTVATVASAFVVSGADPQLLDVNLRTFITHTFNADLDITLTSPAGTVVTITSGNGGAFDNVFNGTIWDDDANPAGQVPYTSNSGLVTDHTYANLVVAPVLTPEEPLSAFVGENPNGTWTLTISDHAAGDGGNLASWSLDFNRRSSIVAADTDSDSKSDILWRNDDGTLTIWEMNGGSIKTAPGFGVVPNGFHIQETGDFDGDRRSDIVWRHDDGTVVLWLMDGPAIKSAPGFGVTANSWHIQGSGDFNGDGTSDLLWRNDDGTVVEWLMQNGSIQSAPGFGVTATSWHIQGTGDFDGDGKTDILWRNNDGSVVTWLMDGDHIKDAPGFGITPTSWHVQGTGDFDGYETSDILWRHDDGTVVIWQMNGGAIEAAPGFGVVTNDWHVANTGDYDGDGRDDILWRNDNGTTVEWQLDGGSIKLAPGFGVVSNDWHVNGHHYDLI